MKIIIVANSPKKSFKEMYHLNPSDYFIGLDGGAMELLERRIKPDIVLISYKKLKRMLLKLKFFQPKKMRLI